MNCTSTLFATLFPVYQLPACRANCLSRRSRCRRRRSRTSTGWPAARAAKTSSLWSTNVRRGPTTAQATSAETDSFPTSVSTRPVFLPAWTCADAAYVAVAALNSKRFGNKARADLAMRVEKLRATIADARTLFVFFSGLYPCRAHLALLIDRRPRSQVPLVWNLPHHRVGSVAQRPGNAAQGQAAFDDPKAAGVVHAPVLPSGTPVSVSRDDGVNSVQKVW